MKITAVIAVLSVSALLSCQSPGGKSDRNYETISVDPNRDTQKARALNATAADKIDEGDLAEAESILKQALKADIMFGPAHNNLGLVYLKQANLYQAAWEFNYAAKLMPFSPQPLNNLGLVYERAMRISDAVENFEKAIALQPDNPELIGNAARAKVKRGDKDERTRELLEELILKDTRTKWVEWARRNLVLLQNAGTDESN